MEIYFARASWMWSLSLIVVTISIHATGVVMMALGMVRIRSRLEDRHLGLWYVVPTLTGVIATIGLLLTALHGIEAAIWAAAYVWLGALDSPIEAMLYSVDSMTTPLWGSIALLQIQCDVGRVHRLRKFRGLCSILMVRSPNRSGHLASYRHLLANVCIRATARRPGTTAMAHSGPRQSVLDARFLDRLAGRPYD